MSVSNRPTPHLTTRHSSPTAPPARTSLGHAGCDAVVTTQEVVRMAHMVESMFSVRQTPWHGLGTLLQDAPTIDDGLRLAGLDWSVSRRRLYTIDGTPAPAFAVVRDTDSKILGAVG